MSLEQRVQHLAVERHTWQPSLVELPHIIILDQTDRNPERTDFIARMVQDACHQLAEILLRRKLGSVLGELPLTRRAEVDALVIDSIRRYDIKETVSEQLPQVNSLILLLVCLLVVLVLVRRRCRREGVEPTLQLLKGLLDSNLYVSYQLAARYLVFEQRVGIACSLHQLHIRLPILLELRVWQTVSLQEELRIELQLLVRDCPLRIILEEL